MTRTYLNQKADELGAAVERGAMSLDDAAQQLFDYADGGLTHFGAVDWVKNWRALNNRSYEWSATPREEFPWTDVKGQG